MKVFKELEGDNRNNFGGIFKMTYTQFKRKFVIYPEAKKSTKNFKICIFRMLCQGCVTFFFSSLMNNDNTEHLLLC